MRLYFGSVGKALLAFKWTLPDDLEKTLNIFADLKTNN